MAYVPQFTVSPALLRQVEEIAALRQRIAGAIVDVAWVPALQSDARARNAHSSTAIEGNPLTLQQVRAVGEGEPMEMAAARARREVVNYFAGLRFIAKHSKSGRMGHDQILKLHGIIARGVMDQGDAGRYRTIHVRVGTYMPPSPHEVSGLMRELIAWWNADSAALSPVLTSSIIHYRFEAIHPFADGNGRMGRALALWELYRRGFDTHHIFSVDEFYWEDRPRYYAALAAARSQGDDLTGWLEYTAEGLLFTLQRAWKRIQQFQSRRLEKKLLLRPRQERLLQLLGDSGSLSPREIWKELSVSKQGAMDLLRPLIKAGLIRRVGTLKSGRYRLRGR